MPRRPRAKVSPADVDRALVADAIGELIEPALILDAQLRIRVATQSACNVLAFDVPVVPDGCPAVHAMRCSRRAGAEPRVSAREKTFVHGALKCTVSNTNLVFDSVQRTPLDSDWGCEIADYTQRPIYSVYLRAHFPPAMVEEIEALLRARGAFDRTPEPAPAPCSPPPERGPSPPCTRLGLETLAGAIVGALGSPLGEGVWSDVELDPYTRRCATSTRTAGELRVELSLTETFCDSIGGVRLIGARAAIVVLLGGQGRIDVAFPPMVVTGPRGLLDVLVNAEVIDARSVEG